MAVAVHFKEYWSVQMRNCYLRCDLLSRTIRFAYWRVVVLLLIAYYASLYVPEVFLVYWSVIFESGFNPFYVKVVLIFHFIECLGLYPLPEFLSSLLECSSISLFQLLFINLTLLTSLGQVSMRLFKIPLKKIYSLVQLVAFFL